MNNRPTGCRSSEKQPRSIDINNNKAPLRSLPQLNNTTDKVLLNNFSESWRIGSFLLFFGVLTHKTACSVSDGDAYTRHDTAQLMTRGHEVVRSYTAGEHKGGAPQLRTQCKYLITPAFKKLLLPRRPAVNM
jgi:hypothetical protein